VSRLVLIRLPRLGEREHGANDRAEPTPIDQPCDLRQLRPARLHDEVRGTDALIGRPFPEAATVTSLPPGLSTPQDLSNVSRRGSHGRILVIETREDLTMLREVIHVLGKTLAALV
jgi:hypothetical protein